MAHSSRVLVLGAFGLLGSSLVHHLRSSGHEVLCHSRSGHADVVAELTDEGQVAAALSAVQPDVIVNLAALTNVDECERNPPAAYRGNVRVVENVAQWIEGQRAACHLVHISTDQVYDGPGPHREDDSAPSNYYGFSKYAGELAAARVASTVLRTNFFGPSECPGRTSLSDWVTGSLRQGKTITVFDDVWFSPLTLHRLSAMLIRVVEGRPRGVFNLGSRDGMSKADFAFAIAGTLGLPSVLLQRGTSTSLRLAAYRPKDMRMDSSRFEQALDLELPTLTEEIATLKASPP